MKIPLEQKPKLWLLWLLGVPIILYVMGICLVMYAEHLIEQKIAAYDAEYAAVDVSLISRSVHITNLIWSPKLDSGQTYTHFLHLKSVSVKGISILALIVNKSLKIKSLTLDSGLFQYHQSSDSVSKGDVTFPFQSLTIQTIFFHDISLVMKSDSIKVFSATLNGTLLQPHVIFEKYNNPGYQLADIDLVVSQISFNAPKSKYGMDISRLHFNSRQKEITIDSFIVEPNSIQRDVSVKVFIPKMLLKKWQLSALFDTSFVAAKLIINNFEIYSYRDKRIDVVRTDYKALPMESFISFPLKVKLDSVLINDGYILAEEISKTGGPGGKVTFEHIDAELVGLNNRRSAQASVFAVLSATGYLMGKGKVEAVFTLPQDGSPTYHAEGTVSDMDFEALNQPLNYIAHLGVSMGHLNRLDFDFHYTDSHSRGNISIDYQDLRLHYLNSDYSVNRLKSFMLNTMIKSRRGSQGTTVPAFGTIDIQRDQQRHIFNVWWKSIQDGLKSSILVNDGNGLL